MSECNTHRLNFHCGICSKRLSDEDALFTSCGHFFCADSSNGCTRLKVGNPAGKCEQCGQNCDAGNLANRASGYDERVQTFIFADIAAELRKLAEMIEFRDRHFEILSDNSASLAASVRNLKAKYNKEIDELRTQNEWYRKQLEQRPLIDPEVIVVSPERRAEPARRYVVERQPGRQRTERALGHQSYASAALSQARTERHESSFFAQRRTAPSGGTSFYSGAIGKRREQRDRLSRLSHFQSVRSGGNHGRALDDWQSRISTVARPSATADQMDRAGRRGARVLRR